MQMGYNTYINVWPAKGISKTVHKSQHGADALSGSMTTCAGQAALIGGGDDAPLSGGACHQMGRWGAIDLAYKSVNMEADSLFDLPDSLLSSLLAAFILISLASIFAAKCGFGLCTALESASVEVVRLHGSAFLGPLYRLTPTPFASLE
jgi:hypothetical protein